MVRVTFVPSDARGGVDRVADQSEDRGHRPPEDPEDKRGERGRQRKDEPVLDKTLSRPCAAGTHALRRGRRDWLRGHVDDEAQVVAVRR